jgi:hypothetical protein
MSNGLRELSTFPRQLATTETLLVRRLIQVQGRNPDGFSAAVLADGTLSVRSPSAVAFYPAEAWTSRFLLHLHRGFFDARAIEQPVR